MALLRFRCAVIQATRDNYLAAARARTLFGSDAGKRRLYAVLLSLSQGGRTLSSRTLLNALRWIHVVGWFLIQRFGGRFGGK